MNIDLKKLFSKADKKILIYVFGAIGVLLMLFSSCSEKETVTIENEPKENYCQILEERLEDILPEIANVGRVDVMITAKNYGEIKLAESGNNEERETIILNQKGGGEDTKIIEEIYPQIQGVIIVAQGGKSDKVKRDLTEAVTALLGVSAHKIKVFERKSG